VRGGARVIKAVPVRRDVALVVATTVLAFLAVQQWGRRYVFFDMKIYHGAMEWWVAGGPLYEYNSPTDLGFTYPPFAAVAMLPMAIMSATVAGWMNTVASVAALAAVLAMLLLPMADRYGWPRWPTLGMALPLALAMEPGRETLGFGQVNLLLFGLVMADLLALRWRAAGGKPPLHLPSRFQPAGPLLRFVYSGGWAGVGIGLATAVKLTPGLFIVYLLVSKQRRAAAVASITAAGASVAAWLLAPRESLEYFTRVLWQTDRVGADDFTPNQSLAGLLARLYDSTDAPGLLWLSFTALCCALGLTRAVTAHREGDELTAFTLVGLTATIISPISWTHHLVFVIPAVIVLLDAALRARDKARIRYGAMAIGCYVLFVVSPVWWPTGQRLDQGGSHYANGLPGLLAENSMILAVILLVGLLPSRPGAAPALPLTVAGFPAWVRRPAGSSGSIGAARSRTSSPAAPTASS
jgi:alpha-1,2-mannosyltransferase